MARSIPIVAGSYYHIYNRGNNRQPIFLESENYLFFLKRLLRYFSNHSVDLLVYCLMPNHFHLLVTCRRPIEFPNVMRSFSTAYVKSFNRLYNRTGHLFEGDYQAKVIDKESYLCNVIRYIHLNPCFARLVAQPEDWHYSDYHRWIDATSRIDLPFIALRDKLFGSAFAYKEFAQEYTAAKAQQKEIERYLALPDL